MTPFRILALTTALFGAGSYLNNPAGDIQVLGGGLPGAPGERGPAGPAGPLGPPGNTVLTVSMQPSPDLGRDGDYAYNPTTQQLYGPKTLGTWSNTPVSLKGAQGPIGPTTGNTVLHGTGAPSPFVGNDNDFYIDQSVPAIWGPKAAGSWPGSGFSLKGADSTVPGPVGPIGPAGRDGNSVVGPQGPIGPASTVPGPIGPMGPSGRDGNSVVGPQGPIGPASTVPGPIGPVGPAGRDGNSIVGPSGPAGADSTVPGPIGPTGPAGRDGNSIVGPAGPAGPSGAASTVPGPSGPAGQDGRNGTLFYSGTGAPLSSLGNPCDFYISKDSTVLYGPKIGSAWGSGVSLIGPAGPAGTGGGSNPNSFPLLAPNGNVSGPSYAFSASPNTGLGSSSGSTLDLVTNGVSALNISPSQVSTFSGPVSVANGGSNHLNLSALASTTGIPTIKTTGTFSAASNVANYWQWNMASINTVNGIETPVFRMSLKAASASAPTLYSFDNVNSGYNIFSYDDTARAWNYGSTQILGTKIGLTTTAAPGTVNAPLSLGPASVADGATPLQLYSAPSYAAYVGVNNASTGLGARFGYTSYTATGFLQGTAINSTDSTPISFNHGNSSSPNYALVLRPNASATIGVANGTTLAPNRGLFVQGDTVLNGNVTINGTYNGGVSLQYPNLAPTGTTAALNVPYSFAANANSGLGFNTTTGSTSLFVAGNPTLNAVGNSVGIGNPVQSVDPEIPLQFNVPANVGRSVAFYNLGALAALLEYNNYASGGTNFPTGLWLRSYKAGDSISMTASTTAGTANYGIRIAPSGAVSVGSSSNGVNALNVNGGSTFGPGLLSTTAPTNGIAVQGSTYAKGGLSVGAATAGVRSVYTVESAAAEGGIDRGANVTTHQLSASSAISAEYDIFDGTTTTSIFGYNKYTADGVPVSTNVSTLNGPMIFGNGASYLQIGASFYNATNTYKWHFGPIGATAPVGASTVSVKGNATIGSGISGSTAAPTDGLLVQGDTVLQGNVTIAGRLTPSATVTPVVNTATAVTVSATASQSGAVFTFDAGGTLSLPTCSAANRGISFTVASTSANALNLTPQATDTLIYPGGTKTGAAYTSQPAIGSTATATCVKANTYQVTAQLGTWN